MADNLTAPAAGASLATDDIGGVHYPRTKISIGADGSATDLSTANPMPISAPSAIGVTGPLTDVQLRATAVPVSGAVTVSGVSTATKQDEATAAINALAGGEYEAVAASQTNQALGASGATGDLLSVITIVPASTSPGAVSIKDGAGTAITVFAGGTDSVGSLVPIQLAINALSTAGAWQISTGANVSVLAVGRFS